MECPICYQEIIDGSEEKLHCGHKFHIKCIQEWFWGDQEAHECCPMCRENQSDCNFISKKKGLVNNVTNIFKEELSELNKKINELSERLENAESDSMVMNSKLKDRENQIEYAVKKWKKWKSKFLRNNLKKYDEIEEVD
tara:strand:+ start:476 stop:892 length:417 start_codon:yes stop_codon:yes gene_type:complete